MPGVYKSSLRTAAMLLAVALSSQVASATVITEIEFDASVQAGSATPGTPSYSIDSGTPGLQLADEATAVLDNESGSRGLATAQGIAELTDEEVSFAAQSAGLGRTAITTTTTLTQQFTNDRDTGVMGTYNSLILPGVLNLSTDDGIAGGLASYDLASVGFEIDIALDGASIFNISASLDQTGTVTSSNTGDLLFQESLASESQARFRWGVDGDGNLVDSPISLDLGFFDADQTKEIVLTMTTTALVGATRNGGLSNHCTEITGNDCLLSLVSIGDPPNGGYGQVMLFSTYAAPVDVPEPQTLALFALAVGALLVRRRRTP